MTPNHKCIVTGGGTGADGELCIWQDLNQDVRGHCLFSDGKAGSIYAMAISPSGKYIATGSKIGLVRVWPFLDQDLLENSSPLFEIYHQLCPVTALAFITDDLFLSAGVNGKIRVISISQEKHLKDLDAHSGPICSLVALGSKVVASLGIDGKLKIWDMDSLSCEFQKEGFLFPDKFSLFPTLAFSKEAGYLCCPSADGKLHLFDLQNACLHDAFNAHQGTFYAIAGCGKYLVTGGTGDHKLKLLDLRAKKPVSELETGTSFLRLHPLGKEKVVALCYDPDESQSLRLFMLPELKPSGAIMGLDLRSIATVPLPVVEQRENVELMRCKNDLIDKARSRIKNPEDMGPFLEQLAEKGFWAEAKILQADSAKARKKPLHELGFLLQLTNAIKMTKRTVPVFHRLALLLEQLNEPKLATEYFETIEPFLEGAENIIHSLKANPLYNLDQEKTIRSDISPLKVAIQEMEKETVLRRPFRWRLIIPSREPRVFVIQALHSLNLWEKRLQNQTSSKGRNIEMEQEKVVFFDGQNIRELGWLKISQIGIRCPSPYLDYAIEINQENGQAQGYGIFNPNKMINSIDNPVTHNAILAQTYQSIHQRREVENWLNKVHDRLRELDRDSFFTRS